VKVDFFLVGTQKGGSTALHSQLSRVSGLQMARCKELHFFDNELLNWSQVDYTSMHACFDWEDEDVKRGEATPSYCYWPLSMRRIHAYNPEAKIVMLLRHPAYRAYSHWRMEFKRGYEWLSFADAISDKRRARLALARGGVLRSYSYVERGFYSDQIKRLKSLFPDRLLLFLRTDELWLSPQETLDRVARFLGVAPSGTASSDYVVPPTRNLRAIPPQENLADSIRHLTDLYTADIQEAERFTGLSLSDWLAPGYREPMSPP
jgi:hypothetical protein